MWCLICVVYWTCTCLFSLPGSGNHTSSAEYHSAPWESGSDSRLLRSGALFWKTQSVFHPLCRSTCQEYVPVERTREQQKDKDVWKGEEDLEDSYWYLLLLATRQATLPFCLFHFRMLGTVLDSGFLSLMWQLWFTPTAVLTLIFRSGRWHGYQRRGQVVFSWWLLFSTAGHKGPCQSPCIPEQRGVFSSLHSISSLSS